MQTFTDPLTGLVYGPIKYLEIYRAEDSDMWNEEINCTSYTQKNSAVPF